jgi:NAD(P)H dehydrogenase (quinone)
MSTILIAYYSSTGATASMAEQAARTLQAEGHDVRLRRFAETVPAEVIATQEAWATEHKRQEGTPVLTGEDLVWAQGILFAMPTRFGGMPAQAKVFFDGLGGLWFQGKLANKAVSAITSAGNAHGGQEATLLGLYTMLAHWSAVIVPPGYSDPALFAAGGNPYGVSHTANGPVSEATHAAVAVQARRLAKVAQALQGVL